MNKCIFTGRTTREVTMYGEGDRISARTGFAVNRPYSKNGNKDGEKDVDFINIVAFGKTAKTMEQYVPKGKFLILETHVQTGSYVNKDGATVYTTDFIIDRFDFGSEKSSNGNSGQNAFTPFAAAPPTAPSQQDSPVAAGPGNLDTPAGFEDEGLPWD